MRPGSAGLTVLSVMVVAAIAAQVTAQTLYRWVDENGVVHYSQFPPPAPTAPPSPAPEGKPAAPPEAKPSPPGAKPSLPPKPKPSPAASLTPGHEQAIRELVHMVTGSDLTDAMLQQIAQALVPGLKPALERRLRRPVSPAEERKLIDVVRRTFAGVFPTALFEDELVSAYAKHFTEADAKELLRFYRTPIGSKAIRVAAVLTGEGAAIGQRLAQSRQAEFAQRLRDELAREFSP